MNIVEPYARMCSPVCGWQKDLNDGLEFVPEDGLELLKKIEYCGRISHRSEDKQTTDSWQRFITAIVLEHGDWSITEHASVTVDFLVDRGVTHELVRHRLFAFTQESTRFVNYEKKMPPSFIYPDPANWEGYIDDPVWCEAIVNAENAYKKMLASGKPPQIARSVLPNALASRIAVTGNLRNWRHALLMRTTKETHPQFKQVMLPLLAEFQAKIPLLYVDIVPDARQIDNMRKPR